MGKALNWKDLSKIERWHYTPNLHQLHGDEEVQSSESVLPIDSTSNLSDGEGGGVGGK